jgi:hypothetical protein
MKAQGRYYPPARPGVATRIALRVVRPKEKKHPDRWLLLAE